MIGLRRKWLATWQTVIVPEGVKDPDRHENPGVLGRPARELRERAQEVLAAYGWSMNDFLVACLGLLTKRPKTFLRELEPFKPPRKRGRPRKAG